jgi:hypothetical protein
MGLLSSSWHRVIDQTGSFFSFPFPFCFAQLAEAQKMTSIDY